MEKYKDRVLDVNKTVMIYRCLNRKGYVLSVKQNGKVVAHTNKIVLKNCEFIINQGGKKRCNETKQKNVHAFIKGFISDYDEIKNTFSFILTYNPYSDKNFTINEHEISKCDIIYVQENKIYCQI